MNAVLLIIVPLATAVVIGAGVFITFRSFKSATRPPVDVKPRPIKSNPHDAATTAELKQFFAGKQCASCSRPIAPVRAGELRPGLLNSSTHVAIPWDEIPPADLTTTLEGHVAICPACLISETFRRQHPELVVDRHRPAESPMH